MVANMALVHGVAAMVGGSAAMAVTYPLFTATTRQQVSTEKQKGSLGTILEILHSEGVAGLYAGLGTSVFGIAVAMGIYTFSYEVRRP
jgi:solute carrier family 25 (peroxisomal adenine nucleotide transporter), member 17